MGDEIEGSLQAAENILGRRKGRRLVESRARIRGQASAVGGNLCRLMRLHSSSFFPSYHYDHIDTTSHTLSAFSLPRCRILFAVPRSIEAENIEGLCVLLLSQVSSEFPLFVDRRERWTWESSRAYISTHYKGERGTKLVVLV